MSDLYTQSNKLRVLLVDDSTDRRISIEEALTGVGCAVVGFASGTDDLLRKAPVAGFRCSHQAPFQKFSSHRKSRENSSNDSGNRLSARTHR
jgi:hypothetical protein